MSTDACTGPRPPACLPHGADRGVVGRIHSWDLSTGVDGPGTRLVLFTAGCPLRCLYCQNPDTWRMRDGRSSTVDEVMAQVERHRGFVTAAGGGITVSGGEPLLQIPFTTRVLQRSKELGLHTALDTSGFLGDRAGDTLLAATDLVLLDIKSFDPAVYRRLTGGTLDPTLRFARRLDTLSVPTWVRYVLVPGWTDDLSAIDALAGFLAPLTAVQRVEVLPFHRLGASKYEALGMRFPLRDVQPPSRELTEQVRERFRSQGLRAH